MFFTFDGLDGAGKSTQTELFCQWLAERGHEVFTCRDPGSTALGEAVREILLDGRIEPIGARSETLLYMAARAQLVDEVIRPALAAGKTVVSDRFLLANVVYQGHGRGLDIDKLWEIGRFATDQVRPDLTLVLDLPADEAARRLQRPPDRMEAEGNEFRERLRAGFLAEARRWPEEIVLVDATRDVEAIQRDIRTAVERVMQ